MSAGARTQLSLDTEDQGEAVAKVLALRQAPVLLPINSYLKEVKDYVREQVTTGQYSLFRNRPLYELHIFASVSEEIKPYPFLNGRRAN